MSNQIRRKRSLIRVFGITVLLLVLLVSIASASGLSTNYSAEITSSINHPCPGDIVTLKVNIHSLDQNEYMFTGDCRVSEGFFSRSAPIINNTATLSGVDIVTDEYGKQVIEVVVSGDTYYASKTFYYNVDIDLSSRSTNYAAEITPSYSSIPLVAGEPVTFTANISSLDQSGYTFTGNCWFYDCSNNYALLGSAPIINNTATLSGVTLSPGFPNTIQMIVSGDTYYAPNVFYLDLYVENPNWWSTSYYIFITPSPSESTQLYLPFQGFIVEANKPITLTANYVPVDYPGYIFTGECKFIDVGLAGYGPDRFLGSAPIINNTATLSGVTLSPGEYKIMVVAPFGHYVPTDFYACIDAVESVNVPEESTNVPEFPTIALPMISVVGLLLLFGRRKNN